MLFSAGHSCGIVLCPSSMAVCNGRIYKDVSIGEWGSKYFDMSYMSAPIDSDLLNPANWTISESLRYSPDWKNAPVAAGPGYLSPGAGIEGNMIVGPEGKLYCCYRMDIGKAVPKCGKFLLLDVDSENSESKFIFNEIIDFDIGSNSKFYVEKDEKSGYYVMIGNENPNGKLGRNILSMAISKDLKSWKLVHRIYDYREKGLAGIQYPSFVLDGDDILMAIRVGYGGAAGAHDSNCICFKRIENFRQYF